MKFVFKNFVEYFNLPLVTSLYTFIILFIYKIFLKIFKINKKHLTIQSQNSKKIVKFLILSLNKRKFIVNIIIILFLNINRIIYDEYF